MTSAAGTPNARYLVATWLVCALCGCGKSTQDTHDTQDTQDTQDTHGAHNAGAAGVAGSAPGTAGARSDGVGAQQPGAGTAGATAAVAGSMGLATANGAGNSADNLRGASGTTALLGSAGRNGARAGNGAQAGAAGAVHVAANGGASGDAVQATAGGAAAGMVPYKGVANSPCGARTALHVSWYYNWMQNENEPCSDGQGGAFVPMIWGHTGAEQSASSIASSVASFAKRGYRNVLGFNEPDNSAQSNISVAKAISLWPAFDAAGLRVGSPGTQANANPGQAWFKDFMTQLNADPALRADFLAIHWYGWNAGSCDAKASQLESYIRWAEGFAGNRPIWLTEWGCLNASAPDAPTVLAFFKGALAMLAKHPRVERYAWYPWATNCGLVNTDGSLTALGMAYAAAPANRP